MDALLYFYCFLFLLLLISPFVVFYYRFQPTASPFGQEGDPREATRKGRQERLLDLLKELRSDFHSQKISEPEFREQSSPLLAELSELEQAKAQTALLDPPVKNDLGWKCLNCGTPVLIPNARFCPHCGTSLLA